MKCFMFNQLKLYVNDELAPAESKGLEQHVENCPQCQKYLQEWVEGMQEVDFSDIPDALVPDTFTDEVMDKLSDAVPPRSTRKHSSRTRRQRGWDIVKKTGLVVAGLTALVVTGTVVSPTFANYVNSLFQMEENSDKGMKNSVYKGLVQKLEQKATDQGITVEAKELLADSMRIAVIYDLYDESGKKIEDHRLEAKLIDSNGKDWLEEQGNGWKSYGQFFITERYLNEIFESPEATPDQLTLYLEQTEIAGKTGKWSLEIPIDMKKAKEATKTVVFQNAAFQSPQGLGIELKNIEFSPSATRIMLDTISPKSAYLDVERTSILYDKKNPRGGHITEKERDPAFSGENMMYEITNEKGEVVAAWDLKSLDDGINKKQNILRTPRTEEEAEEGPKGDVLNWWHTFSPIKGEQKLKLELQKIYEKKLASPKFDLVPTELDKKGATFKDESTGSTFTFSSYAWKPGNGEDLGEAVMTIEGTLGKGIVENQDWFVKDENGKAYSATVITESIRDKDGQVQIKGEISIPLLKQELKKLTVSYATYMVEHDVKWEVPFEIK
ncbi:DUF4179 domain-containing protein [Brevibacillus brevis]|uniref:DUF4179 domain-containing protein n=1 Tax=Brevibacillus brevis TaxID=1393 RepID=UPI00115BEA9A|nr:DUF4179 domain-containing protein [Lysinibacillus sp. SDF0063]TQR30789.1 DUF4179 domain-containing protein [Lysinibacillus sp. SDF0063]